MAYANIPDLQARKKVTEKWQEIEGKDPWAVLGVAESADEDAIKKAYFDLAREFHTDAFTEFNLDEAEATLQQVFQTIAEAYDTLTNPAKKAELIAAREMADAGMSSDVAAHFDAEANFTKGRKMMVQGNMREASKLFEAAVKVNPTNPEWMGHHLFAGWYELKGDQRAEDAANELKKLHKDAPTMHDLIYFAARLYMEIGDHDRAKKTFNKVLKESPNHALALRDSRILNKKIEEEAQAATLVGRLKGMLGLK
jgi:curved DNA-binding protein CbpA